MNQINDFSLKISRSSIDKFGQRIGKQLKFSFLNPVDYIVIVKNVSVKVSKSVPV